MYSNQGVLEMRTSRERRKHSPMNIRTSGLGESRSRQVSPRRNHELDRVHVYRSIYHKLDMQRADAIASRTMDSRSLRLLEDEIRCLEELIVLSTESGNSFNGADSIDEIFANIAINAMPRKAKIGMGVDTWPSESPLPQVEGLDLSLITDMLLLSATSPWNVYVADRSKYDICYVSPSVRHVLGWHQTELIGSAAWDGVHPDDLPDIHKMFADDEKSSSFSKGGAVCYRRIRRDRSYTTMQATGRALGTRWFAWVELNLPESRPKKNYSSKHAYHRVSEAIPSLSPVASPIHISVHTSPTRPSSQMTQSVYNERAGSVGNVPRLSPGYSPSSRRSVYSMTSPSTQAISTSSHSFRLPFTSRSAHSSKLGSTVGPDFVAGGNDFVLIHNPSVDRSVPVTPDSEKMRRRNELASEGELRRNESLNIRDFDPNYHSDERQDWSGQLDNHKHSGAWERDDNPTPTLQSYPSADVASLAHSGEVEEEPEEPWHVRAKKAREAATAVLYPIRRNTESPKISPPSNSSAKPRKDRPRNRSVSPCTRCNNSSQHSPRAPESLFPEDLDLIKKKRILLVEDDVVNRTISQRLLETQKCQVTVTCNGKEALLVMQRGSHRTLQTEMLQSDFVYPPFDLVLMDINMPIMDGLKAVENFREWEAEKVPQRNRMIIFAVTSSVTDGDMVKCAQSGFDEFVSKPLTLEKLVHRLRRVLHQRSLGNVQTLQAIS